MAKLKMEGNKIVVDSELCENNIHVFEIVEKIPAGFFIWNIGENMGTHEYIPLCEDLHPENKDDYSINPETLKAVKSCFKQRTLLSTVQLTPKAGLFAFYSNSEQKRG